MSNILDKIQARAKKVNKCIVLPEGSDSRVVRAASMIAKEKIARVILIGDPTDIAEKNKEVDLTAVTVVNHKTIDITPYAQTLYDLRKHKGVTFEEAMALARKPITLGVLMVQMGEADGIVGGACHSTGDMLRPGFQIIKTAPGISIVSSCFIMLLPDHAKAYGSDGVLVFGDCAVNVEPDSDQLADIAIASAQTAVSIGGIKEPRVAMLSFSTKCSARHPNVDKVNNACQKVQDRAPGLLVDGDLQLDAAIEPIVATLKAPKSDVAGKANVLIFPDLQSGNIGYKLVERLAGAKAIGPICQGFAKPLNDLSRGCSSEDIVNVVAITALQAAQ